MPRKSSRVPGASVSGDAKVAAVEVVGLGSASSPREIRSAMGTLTVTFPSRTRARPDSTASNIPSRPRGRTQTRFPGTGGADVAVAGPGGVARLDGAYEYVAPWIAARFGNVNAALGDRDDVLTVNGSAGDLSREVRVGAGRAITVAMDAPSSLATAPFSLYAWIGEPGAATLSAQPFGLGEAVFSTPLSGGSPAPSVMWNNFASGPGRERLGVPGRPSVRAPSVVIDRPAGLPGRATVTLQGFVRDSGAFHPRGLSLTNAVILRIE